MDYNVYLDLLDRYNHNFFRLWVLDLFHTQKGIMLLYPSGALARALHWMENRSTI